MPASASRYSAAARARPASMSSRRSSWTRPIAQAMSLKPVVEAEAVEVQPLHVRRPALVSLRVDLRLDRRVGGRDHAALAGRQLLVGVEAEHRRMPAAADRRAVGVDGAERLAGVLDDRQAHALEGRHVGGVAEDVDRQQRRRALGDRRAAAACGSRFSVRGSMSAKTGRARSKSGAFALAGNENGDVTTSSPSLHADGAQREVQAGRAARHGAGVGRRRGARRRPARTPARAGRARAGRSAGPR